MTDSPTPADRHHFVSKFHQRAFVDAKNTAQDLEPSLWVGEIASGKAKIFLF